MTRVLTQILGINIRKILLLFALGLVCCNVQNKQILETHDSPSKIFSLTVELGDRNNPKDWTILMLKLTDKNERELDYVNTEASDVQKWAVIWYNENTIILNSSDIGPMAWTVTQKGKMMKLLSLTQDMEEKGKEAYDNKYGR